ncbi:MAG: hypothetical protein F6K11_01050 [Leptolyngbya sp. SIO3F4]|nr:hypothetical protein [Leptolyngbya sp. SIO3F4]
MNYFILQHPGHNRVYYNLADQLALAELKIASNRLSVTCREMGVVTLAGVRYLSLETEGTLGESDWDILSRLSFVFALYELEEINNLSYLKPVKRIQYEYLDPKISTVWKYPGKTNELFTKMMINVALLSSDFGYHDPIQLLDPVAGKGTTLLEGAVYGFDTHGIEIESKSVHEVVVFFKKFLQEERWKHTLQKRQIAGQQKSDAVYAQEFEFAPSKEAFQSSEHVRKLAIVEGSATRASDYFKKETFHLIVGDLPYGIFHGNNSDKKKAAGTRNPLELLTECLPGWCQVLKKGGVIVMAWNSYLVSRQKLAEVFTTQGLNVLSEEPYDAFEHRVDKSIQRDILVAKK